MIYLHSYNMLKQSLVNDIVFFYSKLDLDLIFIKKDKYIYLFIASGTSVTFIKKKSP